MRNRAPFAVVAATIVVLTLAGCSSKSGTTTFTLQQPKPHLQNLPVGPSGHAMGDLLAFVAPITRDGKPDGTISGTLVTVDMPGDGIGEETFESRISTIVMRFGPNDCITLSGSAVYPTTASEMPPSSPQVRAITGGTGSYLGARGQVTTTHNADGSYTHVVELLA
jgi:hypothetical protein